MSRRIGTPLDQLLTPPFISRDLIDYLIQSYPDVIPKNILELSDRELGVLVGQQNVINFLIGHYNSQQEED